MNLHKRKQDFKDLITLTSADIGIPSAAVKRDYYIVMTLQKPEQSK